MAVVGIDFGTLNAIMGQAERGGVKVLLNENSKRLNANMVSFQGKQRFLGEAAASIARTNYKNTIKCLKRLLGRKWGEKELEAEMEKMPGVKFVPLPNGFVGVEVAYEDGREALSIQQCVAMMLAKLSQICSSQEHKLAIADAVISVPAFFDHAQRVAMMDACSIAGIRCLRLMHDLTATALEYGIWRSAQKLFDVSKASRVLFIDLGYSSYQVSVVDYVTGKLVVKAATYDRSLGGRDFDMAIAQFVAAEFKKKHGIDPMAAPKSKMKLLDSCEKAKKTLSPHGVSEANLFVECLAEDLDFGTKISLDLFEELVAPLLDRLVPPIAAALEASGTKSKMTPNLDSEQEITAVEIVGGGTRVASVKRKIAEALGFAEGSSPPNWGLQTTLNADESTAKGCALAAAILSPRFKVKDYAVVDAVPMAIELSWDKPQGSVSPVNAEDNEEDKDDHSQGAGDGTVIPFERFSESPVLKRITFKRTDVFSIRANYAATEQELLPPGNDRAIGTFVLNTPEAIDKDAPEGPCKVRVNLNHTLSGTVKVESAELVQAMREEPEAAASKDMEATPSAAEGTTDEAQSKADDNKAESSENPSAATDKDTEMKDAPPAAASAKDSGDADSATAGKKRKTRYKRTPVTVETTILGKMDQKALNAAIETEARMANADRVITETNDMRNDLEAYIYRMRDALLDDIAPYITDADKPMLEKSLEASETWLYDGDGFDATKSAYSKNLQDLKSKFAPAESRKAEDKGRPELVATFQKKMEDYKQWANSIDENYAHIDDAEKAKVREAAEAQSNWLLDMLDKQGSLSPSDDPVLKCADLQVRMKETEKLVKPIMNTPKPKPAPTPAPDVSAGSKSSDPDTATGDKSDANPKPEDKDVDMPDASEGEVPDAEMPDAPPPS